MFVVLKDKQMLILLLKHDIHQTMVKQWRMLWKNVPDHIILLQLFEMDGCFQGILGEKKHCYYFIKLKHFIYYKCLTVT